MQQSQSEKLQLHNLSRFFFFLQVISWIWFIQMIYFLDMSMLFTLKTSDIIVNENTIIRYIEKCRDLNFTFTDNPLEQMVWTSSREDKNITTPDLIRRDTRISNNLFGVSDFSGPVNFKLLKLTFQMIEYINSLSYLKVE